MQQCSFVIQTSWSVAKLVRCQCVGRKCTNDLVPILLVNTLWISPTSSECPSPDTVTVMFHLTALCGAGVLSLVNASGHIAGLSMHPLCKACSSLVIEISYICWGVHRPSTSPVFYYSSVGHTCIEAFSSNTLISKMTKIHGPDSFSFFFFRYLKVLEM